VAQAHQTARQTSQWACGEELERAARWVEGIRTAPTRAAQMRAAASREGITALRTVLRALPSLPLGFSDSPAGQEMRAWFRPDRRLPFNRAPIAVLPLPATPPEYLKGRPRQALRTNLSRAAAEGLTCAPLESPHELRRVVDVLAARRNTSSDEMVPQHRVPGPDRIFSAAYDAAGDPVALNHTLLDDERAGLILMVTAVDHAQAPLVRYALHTHVVGRLIEAGAGTLTVGGSMLLTSEGTRYFQRRTGFMPVRVHPLLARHEAAASSGPPVEALPVRRSELSPAGRR
jgi:hypothetical protein